MQIATLGANATVGLAAALKRHIHGYAQFSTTKRVLLLGAGLLLACTVVAVMGIVGVNRIHSTGRELGARLGPGLHALQEADRELHRAELALERSATTSSPESRKVELSIFAECVLRGENRFDKYEALGALISADEARLIERYKTARVRWRESTQDLYLGASAADQAIRSDSGASIEQAKAAFDAMRLTLNQIIDEIYTPGIEAAVGRSKRDADQISWQLALSVGAVLIVGLILTANTALALRAQQLKTDAHEADRERQNRKQTLDARISRGMAMAENEAGTLRLVEEIVRAVVPTTEVEVLLADSSRAHLHRAASTGKPEQTRRCNVIKPSDCPAVRRGHRLIFPTSAAFDACPHLKSRPDGECSATCIPLNIMGQTIGVMHATAPAGSVQSEEQLQTLEAIASKSGERIAYQRAYQRSEAQASSDPLTGLMNRRSLEERVNDLTRTSAGYSVAYGDLDHFKALNDTHGHETGDKALRMFAQTLRASVRPEDLVARWGGEEFVLVLPNTTLAEAATALERVRTALRTALQGASSPAFTVSFGVAQSSLGVRFDDVLASADAALLTAKREGRDRIVLSRDGPLTLAA